MYSQGGVNLTPLEVSDFSGGLTDNLFSGNPSQFAQGDNLDIMDDGKVKTRFGSVLTDLEYPRIPGDKVCRAILDFNGELLYQAERALYRKTAGGYVEIKGPSAAFNNPAYTNAGPSSYATGAYWNQHLITVSNFPSKPMKVYKDGANIVVSNLGLPAYNGTPVMGGAGNTGGTKVHAYACHYEATYVSNGVTYTERGPVKFFAESSVYKTIDGVNVVTITPNAEFVGNATDCYDKANIKIVFYRNTDKGVTWYKVGEMLNTAATFTDNVTDENLVLNEVLYTDGGVLDHEAPPEARYCHQTNDILFLGAIKENGVVKENKLQMSNRFMLWSCPGAFQEEFEDAITGISSVGTYPIIFCKNSIYRLDGFYDQKGLGVVRKKRISDTIGCVSARSIIQTVDGVYFAGNNGFYYTDGSSTWRVSEEINQTYLKLVTAGKLENIYGVLDGINQRIFWAATDTLGDEENTVIFVGHLKKQKGRHLPFTRWTGGVDVDGFTPVALALNNDVLIRSNKLGYVFEHRKDITCDVKVDALVPVLDWRKIPIMHGLQSICFNFGSETLRKWVPFMTLIANNASDLHLDVFSSNDNVGEAYEKPLKSITHESRFGWGDTNLLWGDPVTLNVYPVITAKRAFSKGAIRCFYRQVRFALGNKKVEESGEDNLAMVGGLNVDLVDPLKTWPLEYFNLHISFDHDDYEERYQVTNATATTLTVTDPKSTMPIGPRKWKLYAYPINEVLNIVSYSVLFGHLTPTQNAFKGEK